MTTAAEGSTVPEKVKSAAAKVPARLAELAEVGAMESGGRTRLPLSDAEAQAVAMFVGWAKEAGASAARDAFGNVFAWRGDWNRGPGVMVGSHLDTVVNGGAYDGALGVVAGAAVLEAWSHNVPICAAAFRAEETTQTGAGRLGSRVFAGLLAVEDARAALGAAPDPLTDVPLTEMAQPRVFLELHVEQGVALEDAGLMIGAVTGITGYARLRARLRGRADHVGTTPMPKRRDALAAAAEIVLEVERIGRERIDVGSVGLLEVEPNRVGVVPAEAVLTADLRCWDDEQLETGLSELERAAARACESRGVSLSTQTIGRTPTVHFNEAVVEAITAAAGAIAQPVLTIPSRANHDAGSLARVCPVGMVFVPSKEGRSHSPAEFTSAEACEAGAVVLALAAGLLAKRAQ